MTARAGFSGPTGAFKYDLLAALSAMALRKGTGQERLMLRLVALITARYNWGRDELSIGRADIAKLWDVDERTVKRELGKLKAAGFLIVKRPGVRGRVTTYGLGIEALREASRPAWTGLGPDFAARLGASPTAPDADSPAESKIVPFPSDTPCAEGPESWTAMRDALRKRNPSRYTAWFRPLTAELCPQGGLILHAPTLFHAEYMERNYAQDLRLAAVEAGLPANVWKIAGPGA